MGRITAPTTISGGNGDVVSATKDLTMLEDACATSMEWHVSINVVGPADIMLLVHTGLWFQETRINQSI